MPRLSNFFHWGDPSREAHGLAVSRPIQRNEIEPALRLILADDAGLASDERVLDFLQFAVERKIDLNRMWVALLRDHIAWALLPIQSPGRTVLIFTPSRLPDATPISLIQQVTEGLCAQIKRDGMQLAQFLIEPEHRSIAEIYEHCGFEPLAELVYLNRQVNEAPLFSIPAGFALSNYSPDDHAGFARAILGSYENSLDCPSLNGKRNIEDVIAGHKATGVFDPDLWYLLTERDEPRGVLILSPAPHAETIELAYLGLVPAARGRKLGDLLMSLALASVVDTGRAELSLAVDAGNKPALKLYFRHGLKRIGSRLALLRDLRPRRPVARTPE